MRIFTDVIRKIRLSKTSSDYSLLPKRFVMEKRKIKGLVSTVILTVCLLIAIFLFFSLLSINLSEGLENYGQSLGEGVEGEEAGEMGMVLVLVASIGALAIVLVSYFISGATLIFSAIPLIFSIKNIKAENKAIRIINIIYTVLFSTLAAFSLVKIVVFTLGLG